MENTPTVAFGQVEDVLMFVHREPTAALEDWQKFMEFANSMDSVAGMLVYAENATISPEQRGDIRSLYDKYSLKIGVLTDSRATQGVLTALRWFGVKVQGVPINDFERAVSFFERPELVERLRVEFAPYINA